MAAAVDLGTESSKAVLTEPAFVAIADLDGAGPAIADLIERVANEETRGEPAHVIIAAIAAVALAGRISDLQLGVSAQDFAAISADLTREEREEQSKRWGGSEMRFRTRLGWTRVVVRDSV